CDVVTPPGQGCCGALSVHSGREREGLDYARALIDAFTETGVERIVVNSAGCGSTMKDYAYLLADDPDYAERARDFAARVRDISEVLVEDRKSTRLNSSHVKISYAVFCLKKKK